MTYAERAALDPALPWTAAEAFDVMAAMAVDGARQWAEAAFLMIDIGRSLTLPGEEAEFQDFAHALAGHTALNLIDDRERIAAALDASPDQRRSLIGESVAVYQDRIEELMAHAAPGGHA